ncbi:MAG: hypothetical protein ACR2LK_02145 [Solirubrobacteraceae bacterium]
MGSRSRKRGRLAAGARTQENAAAAAVTGVPQPGLLVELPQEHAGAPQGAERDPLRDRYARGRARDEAIRQGLEPLEEGERPRVVTVAAIVALFFAAANVIATLTGDDLSSDNGDPVTFAIVTTTILVLAAIGMWARRYWAVLGFQCILGLQIVVFSLALLRVQKWWLGILMVIAIGLLGVLFWKLIRAMARLQMPTLPPPREP